MHSKKTIGSRVPLSIVPGYTVLVVDTNILLSLLLMVSALIEIYMDDYSCHNGIRRTLHQHFRTSTRVKLSQNLMSTGSLPWGDQNCRALSLTITRTWLKPLWTMLCHFTNSALAAPVYSFLGRRLTFSLRLYTTLFHSHTTMMWRRHHHSLLSPKKCFLY